MEEHTDRVSTESSFTTVDYELRASKYIGVQDIERWVLTPYLILVGFAAVFFNGTLLWTILKYHDFRQKALFLILGVQTLCDFATPFAYVSVALRILWVGDHGLVSPLCVLLAAVRLGIGTCLPVHVLTLLSFERYVYICRPLHYFKWFSSGKVAAYLAILVLLVTGYIVNPALHPHIETWQLSCSFGTSWDKKRVTVFGMLLYAFLPFGIQFYCFGQIILVVIRQRRRIGDLPGQAKEPGANLPTTLSIMKAVIGVARLCGIYWLTWFPATGVIATMLFKYQEAVPTPGFQYTMRIGVMFVMTAPPVFNPLACLRSMTQLRVKWMKMLGIEPKSQNGESE